MKTINSNLPLSAFRLPPSRPRRALTLAEVLIAMGLLAVGLLGVAAVFPVGGHYMQTGDIADRSGAIAQAALEDAVIRGYLDPNNWVVHQVNVPGALETPTGGSAFMEFATGIARLPSGTVEFFGADRLPENNSLPFLGTARTDPTYRSTLLGGAYVIDPVGLAAALADRNTPPARVTDAQPSRPVRRFPAFDGDSPTGDNEWNHWQVRNNFWPVRRVTVKGWHTLYHTTNNNNEFSMPLTSAQDAFSASDDLALTLPDNGDDPALQRWDAWRESGGTQASVPTTRQANRDYSWLITVAPESSSERDTMAIRPDAHPMEVSVAVFHKRTLARGVEAALEAERIASARVISSGPGGGELLLNRREPETNIEPDSSPFVELREGQFVMVVGPHPLSSLQNPRFALRWCRVLRVEDSGVPSLPATGLSADNRRLNREGNNARVIVALRGPDWPWVPATNNDGTPNLSNQDLLSNDLRVAIVPGVVAVHTKTMRLEAGSAWSIN